MMIAGLLALWLLLQANAWFPALRFESAQANTVFFLASQLLFWAAALLLLRPWTWRKRLTAAAVLTPFALYTLTLATLAIFHLTMLQAEDGHDSFFTRVAAAPVAGGRLAIYSADCGAGCGTAGVAVIHERPLLGSLLLVRVLEGFGNADFERYEMAGPHTVKVFVRGRDPAGSRVYDLKPWVYF